MLRIELSCVWNHTQEMYQHETSIKALIAYVCLHCIDRVCHNESRGEQLRPLRPQGQSHQEVRHQEHRGGRSRQGHLGGQRLRLLCPAQAVREAALLRQLCHPQ